MLNKERLDELLDYSPDSGLFTWKVNRRGKAKSGCIAGSKNGQGYILIKIDGKFYFAHRLAWLVTHGTFPVNMIDHIDGNRENNKINNLREATAEQNMWNSAADVKHRKAVGTEIVKALLANTSLTRDQAIEVLTAIKDGNIPHTGISY